MVDWKTPISTHADLSPESPSPSKKSTRPSLRSEGVAGPKLRVISPVQKRDARMKVLQLQLRARLLHAQERRLHWDITREMNRCSEAQARAADLREINHRRLSRARSAEIETLQRRAVRESDKSDKFQIAQERKSAKFTLKLREISVQKDELIRAVSVTQVDRSAFLSRVKSHQSFLRKREREDGEERFREKVWAAKSVRRMEEEFDTAEREFAETTRVENEVEEMERECKRLEEALDSARGVGGRKKGK